MPARRSSRYDGHRPGQEPEIRPPDLRPDLRKGLVPKTHQRRKTVMAMPKYAFQPSFMDSLACHPS